MAIYYHVTPESNLPSVMRRGLLPQKGKGYDHPSGIFLADSKDHIDDIIDDLTVERAKEQGLPPTRWAVLKVSTSQRLRSDPELSDPDIWGDHVGFVNKRIPSKDIIIEQRGLSVTPERRVPENWPELWEERRRLYGDRPMTIEEVQSRELDKMDYLKDKPHP